MREKILVPFAACVSCWLALAGAARAQIPDPTFKYGKQEEIKKVEWKASAQGGFILATGNANSFTASGGGNASRNDGKNKIALDVSGAYGRTTIAVPTDAAKQNGVIGSYQDIDTTTNTTTQLWSVKLRYDRFFTANNLGYLAALVAGNEPAGKRVYGGAQIGYSRQLYKSERNELLAELGYDFSFECYVTDPLCGPDHLMIHSLRLFVGYNLTLTKDTALTTALEGLFNLNPETVPAKPPPDSSKDVSPFEDVRINFKTALTTRLFQNLSFRFSFTTRFDNVPAPRPALKGTSFAAGFTPVAEKVDTLSEATLVVTFL